VIKYYLQTCVKFGKSCLVGSAPGHPVSFVALGPESIRRVDPFLSAVRSNSLNLKKPAACRPFRQKDLPANPEVVGTRAPNSNFSPRTTASQMLWVDGVQACCAGVDVVAIVLWPLFANFRRKKWRFS
jgi:hypothetical protein